ncbi:MAG: CBS domain-containing protein [Euryarchaeota archaeon]|nr:CBS domain-containing protein [Euryarchaeota archaeon]
MQVREIMHGITVVAPEMSVLEAAKIMKEKNIGSVLVKLGEAQWGILTERDIVTKVVARGLRFKEVRVSEVMTELKVTIDASAPLSKASELFNLYPVRRLPVIENGEIVGMVSARDVAKYCRFRLARARQKYSSGGSIR